MFIKFESLPTHDVIALQNGARDAYGHKPERQISDGDGVPCRHCLKNIAKGDAYLVLAYRPFLSLQPYAETGPIFLHAEACEKVAPGGQLPEILSSPDYIMRGYDAGERIIYGTGGVVSTNSIAARAEQLFGDENVTFIHVRSAQNNCFQCRIDRG